jgi:hypothetical protein
MDKLEGLQSQGYDNFAKSSFFYLPYVVLPLRGDCLF